MYGFKRITAGRDKGGKSMLAQHLHKCLNEEGFNAMHYPLITHHSPIFAYSPVFTRRAPGYYHELFLRNRRFLCLRIQRLKIKGTGVRKPSSPATEPDFYRMSFLPQLGMEEKPKPQQKNMVIVDPFMQTRIPTVAQSVHGHLGIHEQIPKATYLPSVKNESFTRPERVPASACWSFCEPTPIAEGGKSVSRNSTSPLSRVATDYGKDFMAFKGLPSPPKLSVSDALALPFKQALPANTAKDPPEYTPTFGGKTNEDPLMSSPDDTDYKFDFDAALESLLKVPTLGSPSEDFAPQPSAADRQYPDNCILH